MKHIVVTGIKANCREHISYWEQFKVYLWNKRLRPFTAAARQPV